MAASMIRHTEEYMEEYSLCWVAVGSLVQRIQIGPMQLKIIQCLDFTPVFMRGLPY